MSANRKTEDRENDLIETAQLRLQGYTITDIAERLTASRDYSVSYVTVYNDLETIFERWKDEQKEHYARFIMRSIEEIRLLKKTAWDAYHESQKPEKTKTRKKKTSGKTAEKEKGKTEKTRVGNVQFLQLINNLIEKEAKLLGFYKIELSIQDTKITIKPPEPEGIAKWLPEGVDDFTKFEEIKTENE